MTHLNLLGSAETHYPQEYDPSLLEKFPNPRPERDFWTSMICPEFTALCPITAQPDFATLYLSYIADEWMVESKSLKLYLFSFRTHGAFHEACINLILDDLWKLLQPRYFEIRGLFTPRGGIAIHPFVSAACDRADMQQLRLERLSRYSALHDPARLPF